MGPTLAMLAAKARQQAGLNFPIVAVSSFSNSSLRDHLHRFDIKTIPCDLLQPGAVDTLPDLPNVLYMVGRKFGSSGAEWNTWATNVYVAGRVAERFRHARIAAFSSGNVYPLVPVDSGGANESTPPAPVGEYAMSALGRERMFDFASHAYGTKVVHLRLNYAVEPRYGVLLDIAMQVWQGLPIDLAMGHVNVVWQGYANSVALRSFALAASPPAILNIAGPEILAVRDVATAFGRCFDKEPLFMNEEAPTALLSDASLCHRLYGKPSVTADAAIGLIADWIAAGGSTLGKPTHFQVRNGNF